MMFHNINTVTQFPSWKMKRHNDYYISYMLNFLVPIITDINYRKDEQERSQDSTRTECKHKEREASHESKSKNIC